VLNWDEDVFNLDFAALSFIQSNFDGSNIMAECLFFGSGPTGGLRECRHTYWGEDGYIFYPDGVVIAAALKELSEFYDDLFVGELD
jgi:hypothetical protein